MSFSKTLKLPFRKPAEKSGGLGTFAGVYLPSILQMLGVILFMRLGWIMGHVGIVKMSVIISISSSILFITALSMTSIVTNLKMGSGGSYFIISRSLGIEFGSSIGILQFVQQVISIALCTSGFVVSLQSLFPFLQVSQFEVLTIFILGAISYISTNFALKIQGMIFLTLFISLISVFSGSSSNIPLSIEAFPVLETLGFWGAFSMFFPATTGIESGMSMSGDLKNPKRSLPIGTITAIVTAYLLYTSLAWFLSKNVSLEMLKSYPIIVYHVARSGILVFFGIWGATLSSALGGMLGAPRTLQAIAKDGILPKFLAKGYGKTNQPRIATLIVSIAAIVLSILTDINHLIPLLTMICLMNYTLINFVAFFEEATRNPSWRPSFKTPWYLSLLGTCSCAMSMLMINAGATFVVLFLIVFLYVWAARKNVEGNWDDLRYSLYSSFARTAVNGLMKVDKNPRSWRPNILTLVHSELEEPELVCFSHSLNGAKGFITYASLLSSKQSLENIKLLFKTYFKNKHIPCFYHLNTNDDIVLGLKGIIQNYGLGPLRPNTVILPIDEKKLTMADLSKLIFFSFSLEKNLIFLKSESNKTFSEKSKERKQINLWWAGKYRNNFELCLALAYLMQSGNIWENASILINTVVKTEKERSEVLEHLESYSNLLRIKNLQTRVLVDARKDHYLGIIENSNSPHLTFLGLRPPFKEETEEEYANYFSLVLDKTKDLKNIAFVLTGENIEFKKIFSY